MAKYRKKLVIVEPMQYTTRGAFVKGMCTSRLCIDCICSEPHVHTIHDNQIVVLSVGDWIIPEPDGEHFYPCKPDIFASTYELVEMTVSPGDVVIRGTDGELSKCEADAFQSNYESVSEAKAKIEGLDAKVKLLSDQLWLAAGFLSTTNARFQGLSPKDVRAKLALILTNLKKDEAALKEDE